MKQEQLFIDYIEQSIIQNWDRNALTDYQGITLQYKDVARKIAKFHIVLESAGIQPGDKIAVCGRNSAHWAVCFLATVTYGAVIVPIYNPQIQISAESETKRSIFREKDKTKRSKKESAQHSKSRNKSFVMTSVSAL